jgi:hypothetical protein
MTRSQSEARGKLLGDGAQEGSACSLMNAQPWDGYCRVGRVAGVIFGVGGTLVGGHVATRLVVN